MRDERAQMMLLTAFILLIGFVALAGMVARVSQLPDQTLEERRRPALQEARAMADGLDATLERLQDLADDDTQPHVADYYEAVQQAVASLHLVAEGRGFGVSTTTDCAIIAGNARVTVTMDLDRSDTRVSFSVWHEIAGRTACMPP